MTYQSMFTKDFSGVFFFLNFPAPTGVVSFPRQLSAKKKKKHQVNYYKNQVLYPPPRECLTPMGDVAENETRPQLAKEFGRPID